MVDFKFPSPPTVTFSNERLLSEFQSIAADIVAGARQFDVLVEISDAVQEALVGSGWAVVRELNRARHGYVTMFIVSAETVANMSRRIA